MKKILTGILLLILMNLFPVIVFAEENDSNGDASNSNATGGAKVGLHIRDTSNDYGIRITVIDETGGKKSKLMFDYWNTAFDTTKIWKSTGASWRTDIVNKHGFTSYNFKNYTDSRHSYTIGEGNIGGPWYPSNWSTIHQRLSEEIDKVDSKSCKNPAFLNDVGFDLCAYLKGQKKCDELKKIYILIEPLVRLHSADNSQTYVLSGTEFANYVPYAYKKGQISYDVYSNNLGDSVFKNLINFYLSDKPNDDLTYSLKSGGHIYSYFTSTPATTWLPNQSDYNINIFSGKKTDSAGNPWGSSMQLVWLGKKADKCGNPGCCVPCDPNDKVCIEKAGDNFNPNDPYCCLLTSENDEISTGYDDEGNPVCEPADDYWKTHDTPEYCKKKCVPGPNNNYCCDEPGFCDEPENQEFCKKYCSTDDSCPDPTLEPEIVLGVCTDDNSETMSYFRDGVFNSKNGQLKDYNTFEKLTSSDILDENDEINQDVLSQIASSGITDNSFQALARMKDSQYSTKINQYCWMHCQELFDVQLPDNYPLVYSGRYFRWTIKDSEDTIAKASGAKLCAVDIDLDRIIDEYLMYSENARLAAENEEQFKLYISGSNGINYDSGIGTDSGTKMPSGAKFKDCNDLGDKFGESITIDGQKVGLYDESIKFGNNDDIRYFPLSAPELVGTEECNYYDTKGNLIHTEIAKKYEVKFVNTVSAKEALSDYHFVGENVGLYTGPAGDDDGAMYFNDKCKTPTILQAPNYTIGYQPNDNMLTEGGKAKPGTTGSASEICGLVESNYSNFITTYSDKINALIASLNDCQQTGEILINMGTELTYQTLFNQHTYSTISSDNGIESIIKESSDENSINYDGRGCFDGKGICEPREKFDEVNTSYYTLDSSQRVLNKSFTCKSSSVWNNEQKNFSNFIDSYGKKTANLSSPDEFLGTLYGKEMSYINNITIGGGYFLQNDGNNRNDTKISLIDDDEKSLWNTVYASIVSTEDLYKLDDAINACVCKDGYVQNKTEDGTCECTKTITYNDFTGTVIDDEYNSYGTLEYGTLTVEFMNGSGLYPIDLKYWTLGSVESEDSTSGHFDEIALNSQYYDSDHMCFEDGIYTSCTYDDPNGVCRFKVKNKIIIEKDDTGECDDPPCNPEPDDTGECDPTVEPCDTNPGPEDLGECIVDGNPVEECRELAGLNAIYRLVDTSNPFPNRQPGANWVGNESIIESKSTEPIYSATLTPASIKAIRRSSLNVDYTVGSVIFEDGNLRDGKSYFLREQLPELMDRDLQNRDTFINTLGGMS